MAVSVPVPSAEGKQSAVFVLYCSAGIGETRRSFDASVRHTTEIVTSGIWFVTVNVEAKWTTWLHGVEV